MQTESNKQTLIVATCLCLVCSVMVSTAAVVLRPAQQIQKLLDIQKNILKVAGIYDKTLKVDSQFKVVKPVLIQLGPNGSRITDPPEEGINLKKMVEGFEKELLLEALEKTGWVKNKAANLLGLNRTTLVEKLKKMKITNSPG